MSGRRYAEYKDSGVPWLGEVPSHWEVTRTKHVVRFTTGWTPPTGDAATYDGDLLWANISDLRSKVIRETAKRISQQAVDASTIALSPTGSLLFSFKLSIGQVSFVGRDMYTNEAIATFRPSDSLHLDYAYYAFPLFLVKNAAENIYGAKLLNQELIRAAVIALPPLPEQQAIALFLDRETARIDALVAEQQRLIALLQEKRQAVISHAVTKGLDSTVPMKDSGVEWLGVTVNDVWPLIVKIVWQGASMNQLTLPPHPLGAWRVGCAGVKPCVSVRVTESCGCESYPHQPRRHSRRHSQPRHEGYRTARPHPCHPHTPKSTQPKL